MECGIDHDNSRLWKRRFFKRDELAFDDIKLVTAWFSGNLCDGITFKLESEDGRTSVLSEICKGCLKLIKILGAEERFGPEWYTGIEKGEVRVSYLCNG